MVIVGVRRGPSLVPVGELRQMAGRAGRVQGGADARIEVVVSPEDADYAGEALSPGGDPVVGSAMGDEDVMAFHLLPEICAGRVRGGRTAALWHSRGFHAALGLPSPVDGAMGLLRDCGAIEESTGRVVATSLGRVASLMYFHPVDVAAWASNFDEVFRLGAEDDDLAAAWALGSVPSSRRSGDLSGRFWVAGKFKDELPSGLEPVAGSIVNCVLWWSLVGGPSVGPLRGLSLQLREDRQRVFGALRRLDREVGRWGRSDYFDRLEFQVEKSIPVELVPLCRLPGVGKGMAIRLYEMGVEGPEAVLAEAGVEGPRSDEETGMIARGLADGLC